MFFFNWDVEETDTAAALRVVIGQLCASPPPPEGKKKRNGGGEAKEKAVESLLNSTKVTSE